VSLEKEKEKEKTKNMLADKRLLGCGNKYNVGGRVEIYDDGCGLLAGERESLRRFLSFSLSVGHCLLQMLTVRVDLVCICAQSPSLPGLCVMACLVWQGSLNRT